MQPSQSAKPAAAAADDDDDGDDLADGHRIGKRSVSARKKNEEQRGNGADVESRADRARAVSRLLRC